MKNSQRQHESNKIYLKSEFRIQTQIIKFVADQFDNCDFLG